MPRWCVLLPIVAVASAACLFDPYHCRTQHRFLDAGATLTSPDLTDSGSASVSFLQFRGRDTQQSLSWFIRGLVTSGVTAVHVHRGSAGETGEILFTFSNGYAGPEDVITQSSPQLWTGVVGYEDLFSLIRTGDAYLDVHTVGEPNGALRGQLFVTSERDWQDGCT